MRIVPSVRRRSLVPPTRAGAEAPRAIAATVVASVAIATLAHAGAVAPSGDDDLHYTYLWHLEQPIYWPDARGDGPWRVERARRSIEARNGGQANPENDVATIFGIDDRVAAYQFRPRDAVDAIRWAPEAGAQVSYSGGLIENVESLAEASMLGYSSGWNGPWREARGWRTSGGASHPRMDVVMFSFHHALLPLLDPAAVRMELRLYDAVYERAWGTTAPRSRGFFPSEMAFSTRLIPILAEQGVEWSFVSSEKIARTTPNFPVTFGSGGVNCDPPNPADQRTPAANGFWTTSISRGCGPTEAFPHSVMPQRARHVDPETGAVSEIVVVPCSQSLGWEDGYAPLGVNRLDEIGSRTTGARPPLVVLAHDGDNAWGGGFSYYLESVPNLAAAATSAGRVPTVVERYLADHPVPADAVVHVEDGAWVNADGDFGAPSFLNWNWPPVDASGRIDVVNGWAEDVRNWAVITAAQNAVLHAEAVETAGGQPVRIDHVLDPTAASSRSERAWHFFLNALNSGYMYYGTALDMESKPALACNEAWAEAGPLLDAGPDTTPPTIWVPQRWPWNPGETNFGPAHGYQTVVDDGDFHVWTLVHDVGGLASVTLRYRVDDDGVLPLDATANHLYAGGAGVGEWIDVPMDVATFPAAEPFGNPDITFLEMPAAIASRAVAEIVGVRDALLDYHVEAVDVHGNVARSPIQHVWVGDGEGASGGGGGGDRVVVEPDPVVAGAPVTISYDPAGGPLADASAIVLHQGVNGWTSIVDRPMAFDATAGAWTVTFDVPGDATVLDFVFNDGAGTWDNNGGADWHVPVQGGAPGFAMDGALDASAIELATNGGRSLHAAISGDRLYVATESATGGADVFVLVHDVVAPLRPSPWGKAGSVAGWRAFLADEADNGFHGWFDDAQSTPPGFAHASAQGAMLEGWIDLVDAFGAMPERVRLAVGAYETPDGGALRTNEQVPASLDGDGSIEAIEWLEVELCTFEPSGCCPADLDGDGAVGGGDLGVLLASWGTAANDLDGDGVVTGADLALVLAAWGACP